MIRNLWYQVYSPWKTFVHKFDSADVLKAQQNNVLLLLVLGTTSRACFVLEY